MVLKNFIGFRQKVSIVKGCRCIPHTSILIVKNVIHLLVDHQFLRIDLTLLNGF